MRLKHTDPHKTSRTLVDHDSRRGFLQKAGIIVGGLSLWGFPLQQGRAQDPTESCRPPGDLGNPVPFQPDPGQPVRTRKSISDLSAPELQALNKAYQQLRALSDDDPRSWMAQAHVHCYYCAGSFYNPTQVEIHGGWFFFPWHRAYLYFHERILGSLIGDPNFALPYWDWDHAPHRAFPTPYAIPADLNENALFDPVREATPSATPSLNDWFQIFSVNVGESLAQANGRRFLGSPPDYFNNHGGVIENGPHGLVHLWAGQVGIQSPWGVPDMGVLQTASRDPIFFAHHNNIDRLLEVWRFYPTPPVPHVLPESRAWLDQRFSFYDIDPTPAQPGRAYRWVSIAVSDMIDTKNLGYVYDNIAPPPAEPAPPEQAESAAAQRAQRPNPTTKKIEMSDQDRRLLSAHDPQKRYILHIDGIQIPSGQSAIVKVFINKPDATRESHAGTRNYVGYFAIVAKSLGGGHAHQPSNVTLDVTGKLAVLLESREPTLTLVPMNQNPDDIRLPYERAYIREE